MLGGAESVIKSYHPPFLTPPKKNPVILMTLISSFPKYSVVRGSYGSPPQEIHFSIFLHFLFTSVIVESVGVFFVFMFIFGKQGTLINKIFIVLHSRISNCLVISRGIKAFSRCVLVLNRFTH